jgi:hypothetical protein
MDRWKHADRTTSIGGASFDCELKVTVTTGVAPIRVDLSPKARAINVRDRCW